MRWWPLLLLAGCTESAIPPLDDVSTTGGGPGGGTQSKPIDRYPEAEDVWGEVDEPTQPDDDVTHPPNEEVLTPVPVAVGSLEPLGNPDVSGEVRVQPDGGVLFAHVEVRGLWSGAEHRQALVYGSCDDLDAAERIATFEPILSDHNGLLEWDGAAAAPDLDLEGTAWVIQGAEQGGLWDPNVPAACADLAPEVSPELELI